MIDPYCMMRTDGSAEKSTQPIVHVWCVRVNINATRFKGRGGSQPLACVLIMEGFAMDNKAIAKPLNRRHRRGQAAFLRAG